MHVMFTKNFVALARGFYDFTIRREQQVLNISIYFWEKNSFRAQFSTQFQQVGCVLSVEILRVEHCCFDRTGYCYSQTEGGNELLPEIRSNGRKNLYHEKSVRLCTHLVSVWRIRPSSAIIITCILYHGFTVKIFWICCCFTLIFIQCW